MSKHILLKRTTLCILSGLAIGYTTTAIYQYYFKSKVNRSLSSISSNETISKLTTDQLSRNYFQVKINSDHLADSNEDISLIKATITALQDIPDSLKYVWILEKDAVTSDSLDGVIPALKAGESFEIQMRTQQFSRAIQNHISIQITGKIDQHSVDRKAIISSRPEDSFEYVVQQAAIERSQNPGDPKIQKLSNGQKINEKFNLDKIVR